MKIFRSEEPKPKSIGNDTFLFSLGRRRFARLLKCTYFIFRLGPEAGVGVDQEPGVGAGVGVGTAPPRFRTLLNKIQKLPLLYL